MTPPAHLAQIGVGPGVAPLVRPPLTNPSRFLGRQPIVDVRSRPFGYKLLLRAEPPSEASGDPEQTLREEIDHWLMLIPSPNPLASFVHCTRAALVEGLVSLLPPQHTVLEIPTEIDSELVHSCLNLKRLGYRFALSYMIGQPSHSSAVALADFIKIDFRATDFMARREIYAVAARGRAQLLAEGIETEIQMRLALSEGCSLFQGYFFSHPLPLASRAIPQNHVAYLNLLAVLNHFPADLRKVEKLISRDASLCYRVLRLANSALQGRPGIVSSIREALLLVGDDAVRRMVIVAMAGVLAVHQPPALLTMALVRARFCELLAPSLSREAGPLYLLGMLSLLDVILETSLDRILETLPISPEMKSALTGDESAPSRTLELVRSLESCDWRHCEEMQHTLGLAEGSVAAIYVEALRWASTMAGEEFVR